MAAKKAPAKKVSSPKKPASAADFRKAEEASKKKTSTQTTATYKGQKVDWKTPGKPTEAITNKGQKATGLSKPTVKDRFDNNPGRKSGVESQNAYNALEKTAKGITIATFSALAGGVAKNLVALAAPKVARGTLTGSGSYTTSNPSAASSYSSASRSSLMGKGSYSGSANAANSYSSIRGINAAGKTVLQEDLGIPIAIGAVLSKKKKKK
jgi:hypothetical protein